MIEFNIIPYYRKENRKGIIVHRIAFPYLPKRTHATIKYWIKTAAKRCMRIIDTDSFDLIHAHNYLSGIISHELSRELAIPYLTTLHSNAMLNHAYPQVQKNYIVRMLNEASLIICVGEKLSNSIKMITNNPQIEIIPNLVDTQKYKPSNKSYAGFHFVIIGDLDKRKGIKEVLKAFSMLENKDNFLNVIGKISDKDALAHLNENVILHGLKNRNEIPYILNQCHCLVSFSKSETFGITIIEALSCGVPVLYCASGGPEDIIPHWAGLEVQRNINALYTGMNKMITDKDKYDKKQMHNYAVEKYDKRVVAEEIISVYKDIISL